MWLQRQRLGVFANEKVTIDSESSLSHPCRSSEHTGRFILQSGQKKPFYTVAPGLMLSL
jgi:hypothetical protein